MNWSRCAALLMMVAPSMGWCTMDRNQMFDTLTNRVIRTRHYGGAEHLFRLAKEESGATDEEALSALATVIRERMDSPDNSSSAVDCVVGIEVYARIARGQDLLFLRDVSLCATNQCSSAAVSCFMRSAERKDGVGFARQVLSDKNADQGMREYIWSTLIGMALNDRRPETLGLLDSLIKERRKCQENCKALESLSMAVKRGNGVFTERINRSQRAIRMKKKLERNGK